MFVSPWTPFNAMCVDFKGRPKILCLEEMLTLGYEFLDRVLPALLFLFNHLLLPGSLVFSLEIIRSGH